MINRASNVGLFLAGVCLIAMMLIITAEVVVRQFFNFSFYVVDEYSGYLLVSLVFLGVGHSFNSGSMIRVTFLRDAMNIHVRNVLSLVFSILCLLYSVILAIQYIRLIYSSYSLGIGSAFSGTPTYIPQISMVLGMIILIGVVVYCLVKNLGEPSSLNDSGEVRTKEY
jgi:TRAP-type C4-dicarboxylate transport system permease small subunit